jgi:hydroxymethylpyrimidine/phosphomethylpyrimidine kinase
MAELGRSVARITLDSCLCRELLSLESRILPSVSLETLPSKLETGVQMPVVLSIAGFDPSSGAGVSADLKTISAHSCYGIACITALTVQSTSGVRRVEAVSYDLIRQTLDELATDFEIAAVRIGMLGSAGPAEAVAEFLHHLGLTNIVLDPVMISSSGSALLDSHGAEVLKSRLLPLTSVLTPNYPEAAELSGKSDPLEAARELQRMGAKAVIVTGGHSISNADLLLMASGKSLSIEGERVPSTSTHGTGCAYATSLACNLALGKDLPEAARSAKQYVREAIAAAEPLGKGTGPINHLYRLG